MPSNHHTLRGGVLEPLWEPNRKPRLGGRLVNNEGEAKCLARATRAILTALEDGASGCGKKRWIV